MSPLTRRHALVDIPAGGLKATWSASPEEREQVRIALDIVHCDRIEVRYRVHARGQSSWQLTATIEADLSQACVVTLDPMPEHILAEIEVEFRRPEAPASTAEIVLDDPFDEGEVEPVENGQIDIGRVIYEEIAARLDPFPRAPDAAFDVSEAKGPATADAPDTANPFAVLKALKPTPPGKA